MPAWLKARIHGNPVNNLGAYVRPEYRDVTYFYGIDFHQDLIDYKDREADFLTLYVYLHPVTPADAPLFLLEDSHRAGRHGVPARPDPRSATAWLYRDGRGGEAARAPDDADRRRRLRRHVARLHPARHPAGRRRPRAHLAALPVRQARTAARAGIDAVNATLQGPLQPRPPPARTWPPTARPRIKRQQRQRRLISSTRNQASTSG